MSSDEGKNLCGCCIIIVITAIVVVAIVFRHHPKGSRDNISIHVEYPPRMIIDGNYLVFYKV